MPLEITVEARSPETVRVSLDGHLNSETYGLLDLELIALPDDVKVVVLDMKDLRFISSAGLRVVFATVKRLKARGGKLGISNMSPGVEKVFEIARAMPSLQVFGSDEEMDDYLAGFQSPEG